MVGRPIGSKTNWSERQIVERKRSVKDELRAVEQKVGPEGVLAEIQKRIDRLDFKSGSESRLDGLILIMSALALQIRTRILNSSQVRQLHSDAHDILKLQRVDINTPHHAMLYSDLHTVLSQLYRVEGNPWMAIWQQNMAARLDKDDSAERTSFLAHSLGLRLARIGHLKEAIANFRSAQSSNPTGKVKVNSLIAEIRCLRLGHLMQEAREKISFALQNCESDDELKNEIEWERLLCDAIESEDWRPILRSSRSDGSHFKSSYVIEGRLAALANANATMIDKLPKLKTLRSSSGLQLYKSGEVYKALVTVENCQDGDIPLELRLEALGRTISQLEQLLSMDQEMLVLAASCRWLNQIGMKDLGRTLMGRYRNQSRNLSDQKSDDIWRLFPG